MTNMLKTLEDSLNQAPIGQTKNFIWHATPMGIAALWRANSTNCDPPFKQAIEEGMQVAMDLSKEEKEFHQTTKGMMLLFHS